ncbi:hypothetical protein B7C62_24055 [Kitasatospora albolonga]|uniref:Non-ribosomal peptide synthetase n=1 Tax=Kitasatospora albolonga TaxID=68173 RepID=A0ABC8BXQ4_9ACTN|nr:hypothetical protein B7C62_24055 [Kitasatospora albolonga]
MISLPPAQQLPLSAAQHEMWYGQQADPGNPVFTMGDFLELRGPLDTARLTAAWQGVLREAGTLRARFTEQDGEPRQELLPVEEFPVETVDLSHEERPREAADTFMRRDLLAPPDLTAGTLRSVLLRLGPEHVLFYIRVNHIVVDGFSRVLVYNRLAALYADPDAEGAFPDPRTLTDDEDTYAQSAKYRKEQAFWQSRFDPVPEPVSLSSRPGGQVRASLRCEAVLPAATVERLRTLAWDARVTWQTLLIAATGSYVQRAANVERALLTLAVPARATAASRAVPGMRANFVPHPVEVAPGRTVADFLRDSAGELRATLRHQNYRGDRIRRDLGFTGDAGRSLGPTVNVLESGFDYTFGECAGLLHNLSTGPVEDMQIIYLDSAESGYSVRLDANPERYTQEELELHQQRLFGWLTTLAEAGPDAVVDQLDVLLPGEREAIRQGWASTTVVDAYAGVVERVRAWAVERPDAIAVEHAGERVSYAELVSLASALSRRLVASGVGVGSRVAVLCEPGVPFVAGILGVLGAGAAWVPLDPGAPRARSAGLLDDSAPQVLYVGPGHEETAVELLDAAVHVPQVVVWDGVRDGGVLVEPVGHPEDLAYVIFTSGSTGRPKGAMVHRRGMVNHLLAKVSDLGMTAADTVVHNAPVTFDISVWQMLSPLIVGGRLIVVDRDTAADPQQLFGRVSTDGVTVLEVVPSLLRAAVDAWQAGTPRPSVGGLRALMVTGEALSADLALLWGELEPGIPLVNAYGPTECSDDVTHAFITPGTALETRTPIGFPVRNTRLYILDTHLRPVPPGTPGELYVAGTGVGRGYLDNPARTATTYLPDPHGAPGTRMYRTGDRVRQRADGQIEFLERLDHQIKIRGHRVELGEIETALRNLPGITDAATALHHGRLTAYLIGTTPTPSKPWPPTSPTT